MAWNILKCTALYCRPEALLRPGELQDLTGPVSHLHSFDVAYLQPYVFIDYSLYSSLSPLLAHNY